MIYSQNQFFQKIVYLTLTFDPMTLILTLHIDDNIPDLSAKFETDPTHHSWSTAKTIFSENRVFDLDLWPYDLDLIPNCSPYWCLPSHLFWFQSDQWYMRYWQKRSFVTNGPTNGPTDQPTNGPTNQPTNQPTKLFIEMRRSRWTHLKITWYSSKLRSSEVSLLLPGPKMPGSSLAGADVFLYFYWRELS